MAPSEYTIRLQKGIRGGFTPPNPSAISTLIKSASESNIHISVAIRLPGTRTLQPQPPKILDSSDEETLRLVTELSNTLRDLPTESPPQSEDIYGLDTSIAWRSEDMEWCNGAPAGCDAGESLVKVDDDQISKFRRAVEIVEQLVQMGADC
ncbi:hypothetical protein BDV28DRAFT_137813 [Aspergillus coremiiformis]|uniref:Uncharacterized protein n=1 Tax=Aspergillus coremiiformis TaxID=138285 RepID=A0A5N6Z0C6_9EURO|nr:hypothetical protein BDV28DRAFT_137813 [Aspergillus coremiiformis]